MKIDPEELFMAYSWQRIKAAENNDRQKRKTMIKTSGLFSASG
jgi:hypothetical protein